MSDVPTDAILADPRPASTVVVLRDSAGGPEAFMVRRHEGNAFMGGAHVFPGGRVDAADRDSDDSWCDGIAHAVRQLPDLAPADAVAYHVAAARELFEEAGVLLARDASGRMASLAGPVAHDRFIRDRTDVHGGATLRSVVAREGLRLALDALILFAHWVTPPVDTRQFDTRFFMTRVPPDQTPVHDDTETTASVWLTPAAAIAKAVAEEIVLPTPTWVTLRELEPFASVEQALAWARQRRVIRRLPRIVVAADGQGDRRILVLPGDPLHPDAAGEGPFAETRYVFAAGRWRPERAPA